MTVEAVVSLGANLGDRVGTLRSAIADLATLGRVVAISPVYETAPVGGPDQPPYLNAVAVVETTIDPDAFLEGLHSIEADHDRDRSVRWGARTLDLDLVAHGDRTSAGRAVVPHPRAAIRRFVLAPLTDVRPAFVFPDGRPAAGLLTEVADQDAARLAGHRWWSPGGPDPTPPLRVVVAGPGRAGGSLARAAAAAGHDVAVTSRRPHRGLPTIPWGETIPPADLVVLAVPDAAIVEAARSLGPALPSGAVFAHCSGATPVSVLADAAEGIRIGGIHPLVAMPDATRGAEALAGAWFGIGGDEEATAVLDRFARSLGGRVFHLADADRAVHHAAASMAANHLTALLDAVVRLARSAGVPFEAYRALVDGAVDHAFALGPAAALTGPVARGDEGTVRRQRDAVAGVAPDLLPLVDALNEATRRLAGR